MKELRTKFLIIIIIIYFAKCSTRDLAIEINNQFIKIQFIDWIKDCTRFTIANMRFETYHCKSGIKSFLALNLIMIVIGTMVHDNFCKLKSIFLYFNC